MSGARKKDRRQKRERQAKQTDHICARERRLTAGATLPQATNPPRPVLKSKQTETPLTHVNSTSTNNTLQRLSTPPPSSIPHALDPTPSETSATKTPLVHGYSIITLFPPSNALARILKYMHSHTASAHCVRLVPAVPLSCPEGQAEDNTEERQCVSR